MDNTKLLEDNRKLLPFKLKAALNGAKLVTRSGTNVTGFKKSHGYTPDDYPYEAIIGRSAIRYFSPDGKYIIDSEDERDLFLSPDQPEAEQSELSKSLDWTATCIINHFKQHPNLDEPMQCELVRHALIALLKSYNSICGNLIGDAKSE